MKLQSELVKQYQDVLAYKFWLSLMEPLLAQMLAERDDLKEARTRLESAIGRLESLRQSDPRSGSTRFCSNNATTIARSGLAVWR